MTAKLSEPLPECLGCEIPTRRDVHARNHGLCTACAEHLTDLRLGRYNTLRRRSS